MSVTHAFVSAKVDGTDSSNLRPSNWNAAHKGAFSLYNVVTDYSAAFDNATDDTTAINNAIAAASAAGGGIVLLPPGRSTFTTLLARPGVQLWGAGMISADGATPSTLLSQISGTADVMVKSADVTAALSSFVMRDMTLTAFGNQSANTGGVSLERATRCRIEAGVAYTKNFAFQAKGGTIGGDTMYNKFANCQADNLQSGAAMFDLEASTASRPDATNILDCVCNTSTGTTFIKARANTNTQGIACDGCVVAFNRTIETPTLIDSEGATFRVIANRFEATAGSLTVTLNPQAGGGTQPGGFFLGNVYAFTGSLTFTDNGTTKSSRIGDSETGAVYRNDLFGGALSVLHESSVNKVGFYGTAPIARQTGVAVSAAGIHAALVALGLITA